jgi:hypothetical protein
MAYLLVACWVLAIWRLASPGVVVIGDPRSDGASSWLPAALRIAVRPGGLALLSTRSHLPILAAISSMRLSILATLA